ncbi:MAG: hypothetical protein ACREIA_08350 [Opitutaceae bacterium]
MTAKEELDFVEAKVLLLFDRVDNPVTRTRYLEMIADLRSKSRPRKQWVRYIEREMHNVWVGEDVGWEAINRELQRRFGFVRLGADPVGIAHRVLKRGRIRGGREGEIVREFVSCSENETSIGIEAFNRLALILDTWEAGG